MLLPEQLIEKLKSKGVKFELYSEEAAINFINYHNYYVKLTAYKSNFSKHDNQYVGLDFLALKDLSTIDMHLKHLVLKATLGIEHSLKVNMLKDIQERGIDEFQLVSDYLFRYGRVLKELSERRKSSYVNNLLSKYHHPCYPIWVFLEAISFGEFVDFYRYYCETYNCGSLNYKILYSVRDIRNAAAHNNCIIHNLGDKRGYYKNEVVSKVQVLVPEMKLRTIRDRLKNRSVQDFVSILIALDIVVLSEEVKMKLLEDFDLLFNGRILREAHLYRSAPAIGQTYEFCKKVLDTVIAHG
ncbi:MAG: Abi family protein [Bacillota bacterium]|nr:Abi family protein [Bacillota bacterium]